MTQIDPLSVTVAQQALLFDREGELLLVQPADSDRWTLPGGPLEAHESTEESLRYAVRAATGLEVRVVMPIQTAVLDLERDADTDSEGSVLNVVYLCERLTDDPIDLSDEYVNHGWFPVEAVDPEMLPEAHHQAMRKAEALRVAMG